MKTVAIGESSEYGVRLVRFLENHLSREIHIVRCTEPGQFVDLVPKEAYCVVSEEFIRELEAEYSHIILIGEREDAHTFCKYHSPMKLVDQIESYFQENIREETGYRESSATLVAIYTPIYVSGMREIAMQYMREGSLCLGMEDLGEAKEEIPNMGALCYYIHLQKEDITKQMQQMMELSQGRYFIHSPSLYYDLADLSQENLQWFFSQVKTMSGYRTIYVLLGSSAVKNVEIFRCFDQIVMVSKRNHRRLKHFWECFQEVLASYSIYPRKGISMVYQEDIS